MIKLNNCVYRFLNNEGEIIYIGKAKSLRHRINGHRHLPKEAYEEKASIEFCMFETEDEMDLAERYFIPKIKPKYNDAMSSRSLNFELTDLNNINWYKYGSNTEIMLQINPKSVLYSTEVKRLEYDSFEVIMATFEKNKEKIEELVGKYPSLDDIDREDLIKLAEEIDGKIKEIEKENDILFARAFQLKTGVHADACDWYKKARTNEVFSLEEIFEKDKEKWISSLESQISAQINEKGWYDLHELHVNFALKFIELPNNKLTHDNSINYLRYLNIPSIEDKGVVVYKELMEEIFSIAEQRVSEELGELVLDTIIIEQTKYMIWDFVSYKFPEPKLIKRLVHSN